MLRALLRTLPNIVSLSRLALAAAFVVADTPMARALIILGGAATDGLDGWIARRAGAATRSGALIDPLADRIFAIIAVAVLLFDGVISTWEYFVLLSRDIMTMIGFLTARIMPSLRAIPFQARPAGKIVTALQMLSLVAALLWPRGAPWLVGLTGLVSAYAVVDYTLMLHRRRAAGT